MYKKIFFVGIGGKGLNGIAKICLEQGFEVSGVDTSPKPETIELENSGAKIYYAHSADNISADVDLVVYSSITQNAPEIERAKEMEIHIMKRSRFLAFITRESFRICVCGSHGKSTTTALLGIGAMRGGVDATIFGGAYTREFAGYNHLGKSSYAIIEACEYDRSFHDFIGDTTIVTSVEKSHLEYYKDEREMIDSFKYFISRHKPTALVIANGDSLKVREVTGVAQCPVLYFGFNQANHYAICDVRKNERESIFSIVFNGKIIIENMHIKIPGDYNILNYVAVVATLHQLGIPLHGIIETAAEFTGVARRFEIKTAASGQIFIDDFAHHPTQVKNFFYGVRQFYPKKPVCAVFQPRQFNLIKNFLREYGSAFDLADEIILTDILPALNDTPKDVASLTTTDVANSIKVYSRRPVKMINSFEEISKYIQQKYGPDSIIATIGAGNVYKVRDIMLQKN